MGYLINCKLGCINYFLNSFSFFVASDVGFRAAQNYSELLAQRSLKQRNPLVKDISEFKILFSISATIRT